MKTKKPKLIKTTETLHFTWEIRRGKPHLISVEIQPPVIDIITRMIPTMAVVGLFAGLVANLSGKKRRRK